MDCYLALRRSSSSIGQVDVTVSRCHAAMSNAVVSDTGHNSVRDASLDGTTHCCQSGGMHEPRSTSPVRSSPRRLGLGDAIGILPMAFAATARSGHQYGMRHQAGEISVYRGGREITQKQSRCCTIVCEWALYWTLTTLFCERTNHGHRTTRLLVVWLGASTSAHRS